MEAENQVTILMLAAGLSSRTSIPKGLIQNKNKVTWITQQLASLDQLKLGEILVVLGYHQNEYSSEIVHAKKVINPHPEQGAFSSLQVGLKAAVSNSEFIFIIPLDTPIPQASVWNDLLIQMKDKHPLAVKPIFQSKGGHPVLIHRSFAVELCKKDPLHSQSRLDLQLRELGKTNNLLTIATDDPRVTMNLNTDQDFQQLVI